MTIHAFDFDGTLTRHDSLLAFIRFMKGDKQTLIGLGRHLHEIILMKLGIIPAGKTKRIIFQQFFGGMPVAEFNAGCERFAKAKASLLRKNGMAALNKAMMDGDEVVVVTASVENWVRPFFGLPADGSAVATDTPTVKVIGTKVQVADGKLTGFFSTKNCKGKEKVARFLEQYPDRTSYKLVAYGDTHSDAPLLDLSDEGHYRAF